MSNIDSQLDAIVDAHIRFLEGEGPEPDLTTLAPELRDEARARLRLLEASWGAVIEVPADDPVARRFGFNRAGQTIAIDGPRVAQLRKAAHMELKELLRLVTAAGGDISIGQLFRLERDSPATVSQPVASAIVAALHSTLAELEMTGHNSASDPMRIFIAGPRFSDMVDDWATRLGHPVEDIRSLVTPRALAAQYRAESVTEDHLAEIVRAILESLDQ